ncbi:lipid-A-disaccharide synthase [Leptolyngbya sp. 'hensonii']|uniref:lipid-A-disaccharide synthase n=1 Tax=Leptolyngbya sp. 'hensonii' TaxID=1922337 RepID=UPI00094FC549|nr:lipid-A-disaccharide synthase [Leptolyngbya sp. 'hensonii']OLP17860.1 lipid-A-disaccharide synthase [Leptolyngbya sp. 'hensonii']
MKDEATPDASLPSSVSNPRKVRIFISTGEVSGDLQGALLITALYRQAQELGIDLEILALGGDRMAQAGATLLGHTSATGSIGLLEALPFVLPTLLMQQKAKRYLRQNPPDLVVLIDYMGPNVTIGNYLRKYLPQIPIVYYIAPQEWVWSIGPNHTTSIVHITDLLLAVFPEEARYFQAKGAQVKWVGHPLLDRMQNPPDRGTARSLLGLQEAETTIALLPVSRFQELKYLLPIIFEVARQIQEKLGAVQFLIPLSLETYRQPLEQAIQRYGLNARLVTSYVPPDQPLPHQPQTEISAPLLAIAAADLAIAKTGTVNLEIALLGVPQVVLYRVSALTYWLGQTFLKFSIPFASPPNLVVMREIVPEFVQDRATVENVLQAALDLLLHADSRQKMQQNYQEMRQDLGEPGVCDRAAQEIFRMLPRL